MKSDPNLIIELCLIRHGMTEYNQARRYLGRTDLPVSEQGMEELRARKQEHPDMYPTVGKLFASPMLRCRQTADILYPEQTPVLIGEWKEMDFGIFEGRSADEMEDDAEYRKWVDSNCEGPIPEGESRTEFNTRNMAGLKACLAIICGDSKNDPEPREDEGPILLSVSSIKSDIHDTDGVLYDRTKNRLPDENTYNIDDKSACTITAAAVVHAGTIMSIVSTLTGVEYYDCYVKNGEGYRLVFEA